jgi:hypothetical protein
MRARPRSPAHPEGERVPQRARHRGPRPPHLAPRRGDEGVFGANPPGLRDRVGDGQRAARLPHRSVPDPGDRHLGEDALDCAPARGGGLFETGAGGSAPKHVQQFQKEGYLRWDSLGEFSALGASLEHIALTTNNPKAGCSPTPSTPPSAASWTTTSPRRVRWARSTTAAPLLPRLVLGRGPGRADDGRRPQAAHFAPVAKALGQNEAQINSELLAAQGRPWTSAGTTTPTR